jgi:hypothetical protein
MTQAQPEALTIEQRVDATMELVKDWSAADMLAAEDMLAGDDGTPHAAKAAAAEGELRRAIHGLHARNAELEAQLKARAEQEAAIGAGGVEPLRRQCLHQIQEPATALDDSDLEDVAHSANQEALSFGLSFEVFMRLAKTVRDRAMRAQAAPNPLHQHLLDLLGAKDHEHAATIIARHRARDLAAAPAAVEVPAAQAGTKFFSYDPCDDLSLHDTADAARAAAQNAIDIYREDASEGWAEDVERVCWGAVLEQATEIKIKEDLPPHAFAFGVAGYLPPVDYVLQPTECPAQAAPAAVADADVLAWANISPRDGQVYSVSTTRDGFCDTPLVRAPVAPDAAAFALRALVASGFVTQEKVDQAIALPPSPHSGEGV